jgi:alpha-glucosidase (family GH31 glycosyl hydrolase)
MMWSDIDYMQNYRNFIYDSEIAYKGLPEFVTQLHNMNMRYVLILDAGISARPLPEDNYPEYVDGLNKGVYMTINNNEPFIG